MIDAINVEIKCEHNNEDDNHVSDVLRVYWMLMTNLNKKEPVTTTLTKTQIYKKWLKKVKNILIGVADLIKNKHGSYQKVIELLNEAQVIISNLQIMNQIVKRNQNVNFKNKKETQETPTTKNKKAMSFILKRKYI